MEFQTKSLSLYMKQTKLNNFIKLFKEGYSGFRLFIMYATELTMKRSQSECLSFPSPIFSPLPIKKASRISSNIAKELFDLPQQLDEIPFIPIKPRANTTPNFVTVRSTVLKPDSDTSKYLFRLRFSLILISEGSSESNGNSFMRECESPSSFSKNPFCHDHIFENVSFELPARSSNPIIRDACFKLNDKRLFESSTIIA